MGKAVLIYGGTFKDRVETLKKQGFPNFEDKSDPDFLLIKKEPERKSIGIAQSRDLKKFLREKPLSADKKTAVISEAELLTTEAQNALLKIIEEPPSYAEIFLLSKTENSLLDTVVSRCVKKKAMETEYETKTAPEIDEILSMDPGERIDKAKEISELERDEIIDKLEDWVRSLHVSGRVGAAKNILEVKKALEETNVNQRIAVEYLLLDL